MNKHYVIDGHCDTLHKLYGTNFTSNDIRSMHVTIDGLLQGNIGIQFFAIWFNPQKVADNRFTYAKDIAESYHSLIHEKQDILLPITSSNDLTMLDFGSRIGTILTLEGGDALEGRTSNLEMFYDMGVRVMTLTWNHRNEIADGVLDENPQKGLSSFGREVIIMMNELGMLVDISHLGEKSFWDVIQTSSQPIIASHSNAKSLCQHPRNLRNDQIQAVAHSKGLIGINFYPPFLSQKRSSISDIIKHIEYIAGLIGVDYIGFGSDFDGVDKLPEGISGPQDFPKLIDELLRLNYKEYEVDMICQKNYLRILKEILK